MCKLLWQRNKVKSVLKSRANYAIHLYMLERRLGLLLRAGYGEPSGWAISRILKMRVTLPKNDRTNQTAFNEPMLGKE